MTEMNGRMIKGKPIYVALAQVRTSRHANTLAGGFRQHVELLLFRLFLPGACCNPSSCNPCLPQRRDVRRAQLEQQYQQRMAMAPGPRGPMGPGMFPPGAPPMFYPPGPRGPMGPGEPNGRLWRCILQRQTNCSQMVTADSLCVTQLC